MTQDQISDARRLLAQKQEIVIFSHRNPDGDAVGSSLGLMHYLRDEGHNCTVVLPSDYPFFLRFLPAVESMVIFDNDPPAAQEVIDRATLFFILDFNSFDRIDKMAEGMKDDDRPRIMIDHHLFPEPIADPIFSRPEASSTCELVYEFIRYLGHADRITKKTSDCLYTGILTDTGGFKYSTSPTLFRTTAELLLAGTDAYKIADHVWNSQTEKQLRLLGHCLANRMELLPEHRTGLIYLTKQDYEAFDIQRGDTEGIVNYVMRMPEYMIAAFIHEQPKIVKISLRSKGNMDVQQIAKAHFRGGGHRNAAGGASFAPLGSTINRFKKQLPKYAAEIEAAYLEFNNQ
ncbi:DHH family phosphoesterase [Lewinella sp. IMCC34191]|uniref:DHH family phosphoesterase n=1 Tax=Lewinella sp. IMCC34191 TaxID=2259172 RepID=UPI000E26B0CE|nr:bifunctional oligoribonuclease/PAP phosphatase NrnA [Lewinella sp. IMCC34191]